MTQGTGRHDKGVVWRCGADVLFKTRCGGVAHYSPASRTQGFTLLEVLGALALLALLLLGVYSGIRTATHSVRSGSAAIERLDQIRSAQQFMRRELAQVLAVPIAHNENGDSIYFVGTAHEMRFVAPLPGYLGKLGPQLQQLKLVSNGRGGSRLEASFALLPPDGSAPHPLGEPETLLDDVRGGSFVYRNSDTDEQLGSWHGDWPDGRMLPSAVRVDLKLDGNYGWPRLDAPLRVDPTASGGQANLLRGLNQGPPIR
ncbi:prepilin-type N-terminal cleavage/methylation domain-containing protein [Dyella silvatica]|uniref:prepilin-type N-terminal cleavage/methylation domain-containing protein n=1 Tax=Dyella silvatica TaxID=2992128 RepID=UPI0022502E5E|nr:prepilin-type N-terminal cleavage/methylation domain-containing protein [Dyella silvatica]